MKFVRNFYEAFSEATGPEFREYLPKKLLLNMEEIKTQMVSELGDIEFICKEGNSNFTRPQLTTMLLGITEQARRKAIYVRRRIAIAKVKSKRAEADALAKAMLAAMGVRTLHSSA